MHFTAVSGPTSSKLPIWAFHRSKVCPVVGDVMLISQGLVLLGQFSSFFCSCLPFVQAKGSDIQLPGQPASVPGSTWASTKQARVLESRPSAIPGVYQAVP